MKELASRLAFLAKPLASYLDAIVSWKFQSEGIEKGNDFRNFVSAVVVRRIMDLGKLAAKGRKTDGAEHEPEFVFRLLFVLAVQNALDDGRLEDVTLAAMEQAVAGYKPSEIGFEVKRYGVANVMSETREILKNLQDLDNSSYQ